MESSVSPKDQIWFLRMCHHISKAVYLNTFDLLNDRGRYGRATSIQKQETQKKYFIALFLILGNGSYRNTELAF
jgi:hypothetical protein